MFNRIKEMIFPPRAQNGQQPARKTIGDMQREPLSAWGNDDIIVGLKFNATMQLRTPLRVLLRHGEIHADKNSSPPEIAQEPWEGIWTPKVKTFREIGLDIDELPSHTHASDVGPVQPKDYLPFLIAIRRIVESHDTIERKMESLREMPITDDWQAFVNRHGGIDGIIEWFFPRFMELAPGLNTPNSIANASDATLLGIKGIGPAKLKRIRENCSRITENRDADRTQNLII